MPSKFFGALAMGRPVIYSGPQGSAVAQWVMTHRLGYILEDGLKGALEKALAAPEELSALKTNAKAVYEECFSRQKQVEAFQALLQRK